jgi:hypothetical protein
MSDYDIEVALIRDLVETDPRMKNRQEDEPNPWAFGMFRHESLGVRLSWRNDTQPNVLSEPLWVSHLVSGAETRNGSRWEIMRWRGLGPRLDAHTWPVIFFGTFAELLATLRDPDFREANGFFPLREDQEDAAYSAASD